MPVILRCNNCNQSIMNKFKIAAVIFAPESSVFHCVTKMIYNIIDMSLFSVFVIFFFLSLQNYVLNSQSLIAPQ